MNYNLIVQGQGFSLGEKTSPLQAISYIVYISCKSCIALKIKQGGLNCLVLVFFEDN
ncbi:hypothetical protein HLVA_00600 [Haliovirga abyssi]|uniref:Uncharacterized protein n=1 Tax=Haliovirga abyssi TaxID=2996794 RepID=A0AAU9D7D9_9FUSO|nr:hypothetical protein HLVA_00600 [Haliovirga abyssi]